MSRKGVDWKWTRRDRKGGSSEEGEYRSVRQESRDDNIHTGRPGTESRKRERERKRILRWGFESSVYLRRENRKTETSLK